MAEKRRRLFNVCVARWPGKIDFFRAYREIAETVRDGLGDLGFDAALSGHRLDLERSNIVFGFHVFDPARLGRLPRDTIFYNMEQIVSRDLKPIFHAVPPEIAVWDYSARNVARWRELGVERAVRVPVGFVPGMARIRPAPVEDVDVLFYGMVDERRARILHALEAAGLRVVALKGVYGPERDRWIARSKVVLNLHLYETQIFEVARVSYLLANSKAVVSECSGRTEIEDDMRAAVRLADAGSIVEACRQLVEREDERRRLERKGFEIMAARDESKILDAALRTTFPGDANTATIE